MAPDKADPRRVVRRTLHGQVADILRGEIASRRSPGEKLEAESRLAARLGVSLATVREALGTLAHEGLVVRRHGSGTYVADSPADRHVGILIELDISHPRTSYFYLRVTQKLRLFFDEQGVRARLYVGHAEPGSDAPEATTCRDFLEDVRADRLSGLAAVALEPQEQWYRPLVDRGVPVVGGSPGFEYRVRQDYEGLVKKGALELVRRDRRGLALLGSAGRRTFESVLAEHGLPVRREWMGTRARAGRLGAGHEEFARIWAAREEKPDGVLVTDDMLFLDAVPAIAGLGVRVPEDLLVVTHANRGGMPPLPFPATLLEFDPDAQAKAMGGMLAALLDGRRPRRKEVVLGFRRTEARCAAGLPRAAS